MKSLPSATDPLWDGFDAALGAVHDSDAVLIDLRGNSGGDDARGRQLARVLLDSAPASGAQQTYVLQSPESITLQLNAIERDGQVPVHLKQVYEALHSERESALAKSATRFLAAGATLSAGGVGAHAYSGPIAILVDADCASSCEGILQALRTHPRARVFGERTSGYVHFGELGLLVLPHSGIEVHVPSKYWQFPEGKFFDKVGFIPDILLAPGSDAYVPAMDWLQTRLALH